MNDLPSNEELHEIVKKIVGKTMEQQSQNIIESSPAAAPQPSNNEDKSKVVAIGTDHGGVDLKEILKKELSEKGYKVIDVGTHTKDSVDYPDIALAVAELVAEGKAWRGVVIDGAGIGSCMAANKVPGIRAALCYDYATAVNSREHNDANVLTLGAGLIGINLAKQILNTWLATEFGGGRHARRVDKINAIMDRFIKDGKKS
jgi:ribose 5-phosphate isomerase B